MTTSQTATGGDDPERGPPGGSQNSGPTSDVVPSPSGGELRRPRFDTPEQEAFLNLWRTYDRLHRVEEELFREYELNPQQYNALRILKASHPDRIPTLQLASRLVSHAPDITRLLDKLEQRGLIFRERPAANRRSVLAGITPEGLELVKVLEEPIQECGRRQLGHLTDEQLAQLVELLRLARRPHEPVLGEWGHDKRPGA
jgi:DNA-binding MarR family transcriptional regulator